MENNIENNNISINVGNNSDYIKSDINANIVSTTDLIQKGIFLLPEFDNEIKFRLNGYTVFLNLNKLNKFQVFLLKLFGFRFEIDK